MKLIRSIILGFALLGVAIPAAWPSSGTAIVGQSVTISVTNDGTSPFTYQWKKNGVNIAGATASTYVITAAQVADAGAYMVAVGNQWTTTPILSDVATLTVNGLPVTKATTSLSSVTNTQTGMKATLSTTQEGIALSVTTSAKPAGS